VAATVRRAARALADAGYAVEDAVAAAEVVRMNRTYRNRIQQRDICLVLALKRICRPAPRRPAS